MNVNPSSISEFIRHEFVALLELSRVSWGEWEPEAPPFSQRRQGELEATVKALYKNPFAPVKEGVRVGSTVVERRPARGRLWGADPGVWSRNPPVVGQRRLVFCTRPRAPATVGPTLAEGCELSIVLGDKAFPHALEDMQAIQSLVGRGDFPACLGGSEARRELQGRGATIGPILGRFLVAASERLSASERDELLLPLLTMSKASLALRRELLYRLVSSLPGEEAAPHESRLRLLRAVLELLEEPEATAAPLHQNLAESYLHALLFHHVDEPYVPLEQAFPQASERERFKRVLARYALSPQTRQRVERWLRIEGEHRA